MRKFLAILLSVCLLVLPLVQGLAEGVEEGVIAQEAQTAETPIETEAPAPATAEVVPVVENESVQEVVAPAAPETVEPAQVSETVEQATPEVAPVEEQKQETEEVQETVTAEPEKTEAVAEEPAVTEEPVATEEPVVTEEPVATEEPAVSEEPAVTEEPAETEETEEPAVTEETPVSDEQKEETSEAVETETEEVNPEENSSEEEILEESVETEEAVTFDAMNDVVEGDVVLSTGTASNILVPSGLKTKAYAAYTMESAGLLTLTFKSVSVAHGNVMVSIKDSNDITLWSTMWSSSVGTVNFSGFVEATDYSIMIEKVDATDDAAYIVSATPIVSRAGELAAKNNTVNNAGIINVGGGEAVGIVTYQDLILGNRDYYKFTLNSPGYATLQFTNKTTSDMTFYVYGNDTSTENVIASMYTVAPAAANRNEMGTVTVNKNGWLDAGVYFIAATGGSEDGRYTITISNNAISISEKEKNDTFSRAYNANNTLPLDRTVITGLLSESDGVDCYVFNLAKPTDVSFSLSIQFTGVDAAIYSRDGSFVAGSSFGNTSTLGGDGNPYELELRKLRLDAGYYYLKVSNTSTGDTGKYSVYGYTTITASTLTAKPRSDSSYVDIQASVSGTRPSSFTSYIYIYEMVAGNPVLIDTFQRNSESDTVIAYPPKSSGSFQVQYVVTDGVNWDDLWESYTISITPFTIATISATPNAEGVIHCKADYTSHSPLLDSEAALYLNGILVQYLDLAGASEWDFTAPVTGTYSIQFSATLTGAVWKDGWTNCQVNSVKTATLPLKVASLNVNSTNDGSIHCIATTENGFGLKKVLFVVYKSSTEVTRQDTANKLTADFKVNESGSYLIQCVAYDGVSWADKWQSVTVNISASAPLTITSFTVADNSNGAGVLTMKGTTQGGKALTHAKFYIYQNDILLSSVDATTGTANGTVYKPGVYTVQYVVSDGTVWVDKWASITVTLDAAHSPVVITSVSATSDATGAINITSTYTSGRPLQKLDYYVYDSGNNIVNAAYSTSSTAAKLYVTQSGTYNIQVVGFDGIVWADKWTSVTVTVPGSSITPLSVTTLTATVTTPDSVHVIGATNDSRALTYSRIFLYLNSTVVRQLDAPKKEATFESLPAGAYLIQYTVSDGTSWADKWTSVTIGSSSLSIDSFAVTKSGSMSGDVYTCSGSVTNNFEVQQAIFAMYDAADNIVAEWHWDGNGDYKNHVFYIDDTITVTKVQFVVFDGVKWVDSWTTPV